MKTINRAVIVLKPKAPFVDWVNRTEDGDLTFTLDEVRRDCTAYLIPEVAGDRDLEQFLRRNYSFLFECELASCLQDETRWPKKRDFNAFLAWFEVEFHSLIIDLVGDELPLEETE